MPRDLSYSYPHCSVDREGPGSMMTCKEPGCWFKAIPHSDHCRRHYPRFDLTAKGWAALGVDWFDRIGFTDAQRAALSRAGYGVVSVREL